MKIILWAAAIFLLNVPVVKAVTVEITTEFNADMSKPNHNEFKNTTPESGWCFVHPDYCTPGDYSIMIPSLRVDKYLDTQSSNLLDNHISLTLNTQKKYVTFRNIETGDTFEGEFNLFLVSQVYRRINPDNDIMSAIGDALFYGSMDGCNVATPAGNANSLGFGISIPGFNNTTCRFKLPEAKPIADPVYMDELSIGYRLVTPKPMELFAGDYEAEIVYSLANGGDIDFHATGYSDNELKFHVKAIVKHAFNVKFAARDINVSLSPQDGWESWRNGGRIPSKLSKEVPFDISSSTRFSVTMQCDTPVDERCGLKNTQTDETVPMDVALTMPGFFINNTNVNNTLLTTRAGGSEIDTAGSFVVNGRSRVEFRVNRPEVEKMVKLPGSTWKGAVTLIFDSKME